MPTAINVYSLDYAVPPGLVLQECMDVEEISHAELARRCGRSAKQVSEIVSGKARLETESALQFEKVPGIDASIWLGIGSDFQPRRARGAEAESVAASAEWVKAFPGRDLVKRGCFKHPESDIDAVFKLLAFFCVGSIDAWNTRYGLGNAAYLHSRSFRSNEAALDSWLRLGQIEAERQHCAN